MLDQLFSVKKTTKRNGDWWVSTFQMGFYVTVSNEKCA